MTGIILKLFPSICTGKDTYFSASYLGRHASDRLSHESRQTENVFCAKPGSAYRGDIPRREAEAGSAE